MLCYLLLWPSDGTAVRDISVFFGGTELSDALGHVILMFVEASLCFSLLRHYAPKEKARIYAAVASISFAFLLETAQFFIPSRGAALIDFGANSLGVILAIWLTRYSR